MIRIILPARGQQADWTRRGKPEIVVETPQPEQSTSQSGRMSAYAGKVPPGVKAFYALGASSESIIGVAFNAFNFFFYTNLLGLSGTLAGLAITIGLVFDASTDPLVGAVSDRWRSRLGRRHPFLFASPIPVMICLFLLYSPPEALGETGLFLWLTTLVVTMRSSMTLFHVPHLAMGAELSSDFAERTRVMAMNTLFGFMAGAAAFFIAYSYFFASTPEFSNGLLNPAAYPVFATSAAFVGGAAMLTSALLTLKLVRHLPQPPADIPRLTLMEFLKDSRDALANRNYLFLLIGYVLLSATLGTRETIALHVNTYFWELVPSQIRFFALTGLIAPIVGFLVTARLHERFDKKPTIIAGVFLLCVFAAGPVVLRVLGLFPSNESAALFPTLIVFAVLALTAGVILLISVMSALADIADEHELATGRRQEGIFYASRSFFAKASSGLGHLIAGVALDLIRFPQGAEPGSIDPDVIFNLGIVDGPIAVIPGLLAVLFYLQYGLTKDRHAEIQEELRERHKKPLS